MTGSDEASSVPLSTPDAEPTITPLTPGVASTPMPGSSAPALVTNTPPPAATASPVKKANDVTITEAVQIPVKDDSGKITGYINLQKGQIITPAGVENDQIKVKIGKNIVMVPVSSTDMPH